MAGTLSGGRITLDEIHRFPNGAVRVNNTLRWDVLRLWSEIQTGLRKAAATGDTFDAVSTDSWGVDYVLIRGDEPLLTLPFQYRDARTDDGFERQRHLVADEEVFRETGIQFMTINTLYQLLHDSQERREVLEFADQFLTIGDYFNWLLSGVAAVDHSLASTTQLYNPRQHQWSRPLIRKLRLPENVFPDLVAPGTVLGPLRESVAKFAGLEEVRVVATCSHDTGAAVAAVPAAGDDWAYLSSGTWSLLGVETAQPILSDAARAANFTNEVGFGGSIRFLKNIVGLWILQECRRAWQAAGNDLDYGAIVELAAQAAPLRSLIRPDDARFLKPDDMPAKVAAFCRETGQAEPSTPGEYARCILESLALFYRLKLDELEGLVERPIRRVHIVGGGSRNALLNQFTANATGRTVIAGPVEATALGNVLVQSIALGHVSGLAELRDIVRASFEVTTHEPGAGPEWAAALERFRKLAPAAA